VVGLVPDHHMREAVVSEQPRLPLSYYEQEIPVPPGWDTVRCGYLAFGTAYDAEAAQARARGWPVDELSGGHLHQVVDPTGVTDRLLRLAAPTRDHYEGSGLL
jgi:hypothetical protein